MKTFLRILALAISVACLTASPASEDREADEVGSGDGPEIIINEVVEKNVDDNEDENADETAAGPEDLLGMEMNPEDNEIKVNEKIGQDGANKLDKKKCQKCIRSHYRARHADFCETCEQKNGEEPNKTNESSQMAKPNKRCVKCARKHFRARNEVFCSEKCLPNAETEHSSKLHDKKEKNKKNKNSEEEKEEIVQTEATEEDPNVKVSNIVESADETTTEQNSQKTDHKHTKKNKKHKHKNKKKNKKHAEKEAEKEAEDMKSENNESSIESEEEQKDTIKLGPLENLIRFLIKTNTYTH